MPFILIHAYNKKLIGGYREIISSYNGKVLMVPFDGDLLHLFYNKEILDYYKFQPPRTWQEYNEIAEKVHGQVFPLTNKTLMGNCIGRTPQCAGPYWVSHTLLFFIMSRAFQLSHLPFAHINQTGCAGSCIHDTNWRFINGHVV